MFARSLLKGAFALLALWPVSSSAQLFNPDNIDMGSKTVDVGGVSVRIVSPGGFCAFDESNPVDAAIVAQIRSAQSGNIPLVTFVDCNELNEASDPPHYDLCIIGSGPAGLTVANELRERRLRICVLESGQPRKTEHGDRLRKVWSEGDIAVEDHSRERVIGGASSTWDGLSAPLDPIDLEPRPWLPRSGWPIEYADLQNAGP